MTTLPDWMLRSGDGLTVADYEALPEDICRRIEIVDGAVLVSPSPRRSHQRVVHNLLHALKTACGPDLAAVSDADLRLHDIPLLNRRPDISLYDASLSDDEVLRPEHCLLVVEVMSPGSVTADKLDKPAEYAAAGIGHFWRVEMVDETLSLYRYRLDPATTTAPRRYVLVGKDTGLLSVAEPFPLTLDLDRLDLT